MAPGTRRAAGARRTLMPLVLTGGVIVVDQLSKALASRLLPFGRPVPVLGEVLRLSLVMNPGIAFSIGRNLAGPGRVILALGLPLIVLGLLLYYFFFGREVTTGQRWLLAGILGGGVGNYLDRLFRDGGVVDFIDFKFYGIFGLERWPTFNLADATVVVAGILLLVSFILTETRRAK
ncbi:MAG: signal peptidase II [Spirochaetales bacterium]|nr:signal peptidase II [Spirochaetales bacterium]